MFYDVRISIGMLFTLLGTVLTAFGVSTRDNAAMYTKSLGIDANLWWGLVLLTFGVAVLLLGRRGQLRMEKAENSDQGKRSRKTSAIDAHRH